MYVLNVHGYQLGKLSDQYYYRKKYMELRKEVFDLFNIRNKCVKYSGRMHLSTCVARYGKALDYGPVVKGSSTVHGWLISPNKLILLSWLLAYLCNK